MGRIPRSIHRVMRLIDADAMREYLKAYGQQHKTAVEWANKVADAQPTIDAAPVIRCKDCKWFPMQAQKKADAAIAMLFCGMPPRAGDADGNGYCSMAERKDI